MLRFVRRSLLFQLLSVYLLFVIVVLVAGLGVNAAVEQRLTHDVEVSDQALAQEIALATSFQLSNDENALNNLSQVLTQTHTPETVMNDLATFKAVRSDVDYVYWLNPEILRAAISSWRMLILEMLIGLD